MTNTTNLPASQSYAGTCQVCFAQQVTKVTSASGGQHVLVLHGYNRPGYGYIVGNCAGHGYEPFELSCERTKSFREALLVQIKNLSERIEALRADRVETLTVEVEVPRAERRDRWTAEYRTVTISRGWVDPTADGYTLKYGNAKTFDTVRLSTLAKAESNLVSLKSVAKELAARIAGWKYAPETLVEHETFVRQQTAATKAEAAAKKSAKADAKAMKNLATAFRYVGTAINKHKAGFRNCNEYNIFSDTYNAQIEHIRSGLSLSLTVGVDARGRAVVERITTVERLEQVSLQPYAGPKKGR